MEYVEKKRVLFFGLPLTFTKYTIKDELITINQGLIRQNENDCFMYKVQDVTLTRTLLERIFGLGTIICHTGDISDPNLSLTHIKNSHKIKEFILNQSEIERRKRRTVNTLDIGVNDLEDLTDN